MAVVNTKSTVITNADAGTFNTSFLAKGMVLEAAGVVEVAAADDDTSVFRFVRVPSNARVSSIGLLNDAITSGTSFDCGVYQTAENGGAVVDVDAFASAVDLSSARTTPTEIVNEALNIDKTEKRLWEVLGLSADPVRDYDICLTANTIGSAAGTIALKVRYVV